MPQLDHTPSANCHFNRTVHLAVMAVSVRNPFSRACKEVYTLYHPVAQTTMMMLSAAAKLGLHRKAFSFCLECMNSVQIVHAQYITVAIQCIRCIESSLLVDVPCISYLTPVCSPLLIQSLLTPIHTWWMVCCLNSLSIIVKWSGT